MLHAVQRKKRSSAQRSTAQSAAGGTTVMGLRSTVGPCAVGDSSAWEFVALWAGTAGSTSDACLCSSSSLAVTYANSNVQMQGRGVLAQHFGHCRPST
jgi:hypothetical protein